MIKNLNINENLEKYIRENSYDLHPVQKDIIKYNNSLGNQKKYSTNIYEVSQVNDVLISSNQFTLKNIF